MAEWFEGYEDAAGRRDAQLRARRHLIVFALASGAVVAGAPVAAFAWPAASMAVAVAAGALLAAHAGWTVWQLARIRRTVWRLDLSVHHVVGHDASGGRRVLAWADVTWVDVGDAGIDLVGRRMGRRVRLVVPPSFPDHGRIGHRVVRYAEAFSRPVFVDGRPWQALGIGTLLADPTRHPAGQHPPAG